MKRCPTCQEEFADKFGFCPVDGTPLNGFVAVAVEPPIEEPSFETVAAFPSETETVESVSPSASHALVRREEFHLTMLEDEGLLARLATEIGEVAHASQLTWPEFKRDPLGFSRRMAVGYGQLAWRFVRGPHVAVAMLSAVLVVLSAVLAVVVYDRYHFRRGAQLAAGDAVREDLELLSMATDIPKPEPTPDPGPAGMNKGAGGGSKPKFERPAGGGGGGRNETKPASFGKLPPATLDIPQVRAPDPHPPAIKTPHLPTPATIVTDPLLFPPDARPLPYGDPKSRSTEISSGPGEGNGIGEGKGGGVGPGEGGGFGPGRGGGTGGGDRRDGGGGPGGGGGGPLTAKQVTTKAVILSKPEPGYTEEARKNNVVGTVVLRAVLASNGMVTNIVPLKQLPYGLTEKAIAAARQIKFRPATKDGQPVSQYIQIEYNFNIY